MKRRPPGWRAPFSQQYLSRELTLRGRS
jgi:hypothetical protein